MEDFLADLAAIVVVCRDWGCMIYHISCYDALFTIFDFLQLSEDQTSDGMQKLCSTVILFILAKGTHAVSAAMPRAARIVDFA